MKLIYASPLMFYVVVCAINATTATTAQEKEKKTSQRDVNDAESVDYALAKIPVYVIPNTPPGAEGKVPVAVIQGSYPSAYLNAGIKDTKQYKYGFYAPYKTPKVTPIHEPQNEGYYALPSEVPLTYGSPELYQRAEYESAYKVPIANPTYVKYEATPKTLLTKHQSISNSNAYASLAPVYAYPNSDSSHASSSSAAGTVYPQTKKYTTYDPENNVQIQYVIKYVPVPYTVAAADQYSHNVPQSAYITPKPYLFKESASAAAKKPTLTVAQSVQAVSPGSYASSTEGYAEYAKYAESYAPAAAADDYSQQYPPQFKSYVHAPSYKYYDKNAYAKKYAPTSYVLAAVGKSASTHYASSIRHDSSASDHDHDSVYATKLAPVPLTVDKYTAQDNYKSAAAAAADHDTDTKSYVDGDYSSPPLYSSLPDSGVKYKSSLVAAQAPVPHFFNYEHDSPFQYQSSYHKKDVSASISSTRTADSSTEKLR